MSHETFFGEEIYPEGRQDLVIQYKYAGADNSLIYKYIYGPSAQFLVDYIIPEWIA